MGADDFDDVLLDRANIGKNGAGFERGANNTGQGIIGADRGAEDDEIGAAHGFGGVEGVDVAKVQVARFVERFLAAGGDGNDIDKALAARCKGDGRADQADADESEFTKMGAHWADPMDLRILATPRMASSEPMEMRSPLAMP